MKGAIWNFTERNVLVSARAAVSRPTTDVVRRLFPRFIAFSPVDSARRLRPRDLSSVSFVPARQSRLCGRRLPRLLCALSHADLTGALRNYAARCSEVTASGVPTCPSPTPPLLPQGAPACVNGRFLALFLSSFRLAKRQSITMVVNACARARALSLYLPFSRIRAEGRTYIYVENPVLT